jgi:broad specificity phosphatase PhoE
MVTAALIRPGSTQFDDEGRIKGCLDFPLSSLGKDQVRKCSEELKRALKDSMDGNEIDVIYCAPCDSARQTASMIVDESSTKIRVAECFKNLDFGLWQGRKIDELKRLQPTICKQFQANPLKFCPPGGESMEAAAARVGHYLKKLLKKHRKARTVGLVVPEPLASLVRHLLCSSDIGDPWKVEKDQADWEIIALNESVAIAG